MPGKAPKPVDSENHGGLYYSKENFDKFFWKRPASLAFQRSVEDKKKKIQRIEEIVKKAKNPKKVEKKARSFSQTENAIKLLECILKEPKDKVK